TALVAWYAIRDGRQRAQDARRADLQKLSLDYALRRRFELMDRVAAGAGRYEGLLQYHDRLAVDMDPNGLERHYQLIGGFEGWGAYRAAARELGDPELRRAAIRLGNLVSTLLTKRDDL